MHGSVCAAPAVIMNVRRIPADVVVAKLPFDLMTFFLSTCMSLEGEGIRHSCIFFSNPLLHLTRSHADEFLPSGVPREKAASQIPPRSSPADTHRADKTRAPAPGSRSTARVSGLARVPAPRPPPPR